MTRQGVSDQQPRFDGGLNSVSDDVALLSNQFRASLNMRLTSYGAASRRGGSYMNTTLIPGSGSYNGGAIVTDDNGVVCLLARDGDVLYAQAVLDGWSAATGDTVSDLARVYFRVFYDGTDRVVYIADGGILAKLNSTYEVTRLAAPVSRVSHITPHNLRLWGVGDPTRPQSLIYSGLNNGDTLGDTANGGGEIIVRTWGDDRLVAVASIGSSLIIFHENGVSRLTGFGQDDISVSPEGIARDLRLLSPDSIVPVDDGLFCMTSRGAFLVTEGGVSPLNTVERPDPTIPVINTSFFGDMSDILVLGAFRRKTNEILWAFTGVGTYAYNTQLRAWCGPWTGAFGGGADDLLVLVSAAEALDAPSPELETVMGAYDGTNRIALLDIDTEAMDFADAENPGTGDPVTWSIQLRRMYFGDDTIAKAWRWLHLMAKFGSGADITVTYATELSQFSGSLSAAIGGVWDDDSVTWDMPGATWTPLGSKSYRLGMGGNGYYIDITLSGDGTSVPVVLSRVRVDGYILGRR